MAEIHPVDNPLSRKGPARDFDSWQASEESRLASANARFYRYGDDYPDAKRFPETAKHMDALKELATHQPDGVANLVRGNLRMSPKDTMGDPLHDGKTNP